MCRLIACIHFLVIPNLLRHVRNIFIIVFHPIHLIYSHALRVPKFTCILRFYLTPSKGSPNFNANDTIVPEAAANKVTLLSSLFSIPLISFKSFGKLSI